MIEKLAFLAGERRIQLFSHGSHTELGGTRHHGVRISPFTRRLSWFARLLVLSKRRYISKRKRYKTKARIRILRDSLYPLLLIYILSIYYKSIMNTEYKFSIPIAPSTEAVREPSEKLPKGGF